MKRHYIHPIVLFIAIFAVMIVSLIGCSNGTIEDDDCVALLNSAGDDMHKMDYASAKQKLHKILHHSNNRMHRMSADLLMMRICAMTYENKEFYDYRSDAENCMHVLKDEEPYATGHMLVVWHYLQRSYYDVSAQFFSHNRQENELAEMLDTLSAHPEWADGDSLDFSLKILPKQLIEGQQLVDAADRLCEMGYYDEALDSLALALHQINVHHLLYNKDVDKGDTLTLVGITTDAESKEMLWITNPNIVAVPDWIAIVRDELSIVYAYMGDKPSSDYNHNCYFDILDATREDKQMESKEASLEAQSRSMNLLIGLLLAFAAFVCVATFIFTKRTGKKSKEKSVRLKQCLDICSRMINNEEVEEDIHRLLPHVKDDWTKADANDKAIKPYEREMLSLLQVFHSWISKNTDIYESLMEQKENVEGEIYMERRRMEDNKRQHIDRATAISIVQGITPFLDRALHQVEKGSSYVDKDLLREYVEKINAYNEVLGHWVKVRQGSVTLNIENFDLAPLLETLQKGHHTFDSKNITLTIEVVDAIVKADKALTLFMMNTLLDNARKYTPEGGSVTLHIERTETYVEVSVQDTGNGLSAEDQDKINNMKVYDSSQIGLSNDKDGQIKQNKGFGFGLMNCRGIIEKYRKTGKMFDVCQFGVESKLGEGSRFFFRLPKGVRRAFVLLFALMFNLNGFSQTVDGYMDSIYNANVNVECQKTVMFADSAIQILNKIYQQQTGKKGPLMKVTGGADEYAEMQWFADGVNLDYNKIISIRNELCIAALSLKDRQLYNYNKEVFIRLNKLTSIEPDTEVVCKRLAQQKANKNLIATISFVILLLGFAIYALYYYRHTMLPIFNMRQLVEFLKHMFSASEKQLPSLLHQGVSSIHPADAVNVTLADGRKFGDGEGDCKTEVPLTVDFEDEKRNVGTMYVAYHGSNPNQDEQIILDFIAKFVSIHIFFASAKVEEQENLIELLEDQRLAAETEQQRLHVQNMVLDNCLSTIKHETMYYPSRVLQLLDSSDELDVNEIRDVLKYYRDVFGLLSENANRQLSRSIIKLQSVKVRDLSDYVRKSFEKQNKKLMLPVAFEVTGNTDCNVRADLILLQYLLDTFVSLTFERKTSGKVELNFEKSDGFIKFALSDDRLERTEEENAKLFYPDSMHYDSNADLLIGSQYLIAKQIIRDHDERLGHPGCRIYAEGDRVVFTLPTAP